MHRTKRTKQKRDYSSSDTPKTCYWPFEKEEVKGHKEVSTVCGGRITVDQSVHLWVKKHEREHKKSIKRETLKKYKFIQYASSKRGINCKKNMSQTLSKIVEVKEVDLTLTFTWRWIYIKVLDLHQIVYTSDDHSTALMGKRYVRSTKKTMFQKKSLNYYLSNLYQELKIKRLN